MINFTDTAHADSYYSASSKPNLHFPSLHGETSTDVCVVGAGITGSSTALHLAERGYKVTVLEAARVGWGASGRSGGQMLPGYSASMQTLEKIVGTTDARRLWDCSLAAVALTKQQIAKHQIDCDLTKGHLLAAIKPRQREELKQYEAQLVRDYGYEVLEFYDRADLAAELGSDRYIAGLYDPNAGHLHPLNYTLGLAQAADTAGATFFEESAVTGVDKHNGGYCVKTQDGLVRCRYVVYCCNAYIQELQSRLRALVMPVGTYIVATETLGELRAKGLIANNCSVADIQFVLDYFRLSADHRLLFGGGVSYSTLPPPKLTEHMRGRLLKVFPQLQDVKIDYTWGGFVGVTLNRAPNFGRLHDDVYFAQGFSGHGIALTGFSGKLMADAIAGTAEQFDLFARIPHKPFPGGRALRTPGLVLAMTYFRLRDLL